MTNGVGYFSSYVVTPVQTPSGQMLPTLNGPLVLAPAPAPTQTTTASSGSFTTILLIAGLAGLAYLFRHEIMNWFRTLTGKEEDE